METLNGIVVARREVGDSSCFLDILTDEKGIIEASANGAKKITSSLLSTSALFSYSTYCFNKTKTRYTINSALPKYSFHALGSSIEKLALGSYFAQAVKYCTTSEQSQVEGKSESLVRFFGIALYEALRADEPGGSSLLTVKSVFELRYSAMLGFVPNLVGCDNCGFFLRREKLYFLPDKAKLICEKCFNKEYGGAHIQLRHETLDAMRRIIFSVQDTCFKFKVSGETERQLSYVCEDYFLRRVERTFPALEYFKSLFPQNQEKL